MILFLANIVSIIAAFGSFVCYVLVLVHLFQSQQAGFAIACILLVFVCGVGTLIAFVKGWLDELGTVMWAWTFCILVGVPTTAAVALN